jgi:CspA family cold shock protein
MEVSNTPPQVEIVVDTTEEASNGNSMDNNPTDTSVNTDEHMDVMHEVKDGDTVGEYIGQCKWFNNSYGYGFITIWDGPEKGTDIFVHHSGIKPLNSMYKTLKKGEYVMFDVYSGNKGKQAINVRGICNGPLLCDHIQIKKTPMTGVVGAAGAGAVPPYHDPNSVQQQSGPPTAWNTVSYKKKLPPVFPGVKRRRNGTHTENQQDPQDPQDTEMPVDAQVEEPVEVEELPDLI